MLLEAQGYRGGAMLRSVAGPGRALLKGEHDSAPGVEIEIVALSELSKVDMAFISVDGRTVKLTDIEPGGVLQREGAQGLNIIQKDFHLRDGSEVRSTELAVEVTSETPASCEIVESIARRQSIQGIPRAVQIHGEGDCVVTLHWPGSDLTQSYTLR